MPLVKEHLVVPISEGQVERAHAIRKSVEIEIRHQMGVAPGVGLEGNDRGGQVLDREHDGVEARAGTDIDEAVDGALQAHGGQILDLRSFPDGIERDATIDIFARVDDEAGPLRPDDRGDEPEPLHRSAIDPAGDALQSTNGPTKGTAHGRSGCMFNAMVATDWNAGLRLSTPLPAVDLN